MEVVNLNRQKGTQTIALPAELAIDDDKVYVKKTGNSIMLIPYHNPWQNLYDSLNLFTSDFLSERNQPPLDRRESFD